MRRDCSKCKGCGYAGRTPFRSRCDVCGGKGYVELGNVVHAPIISRVDCSADDTVRKALGELDSVVIVGYDRKGNEYYASNVADGANALWHLQRGVHNLMTIVDKSGE